MQFIQESLAIWTSILGTIVSLVGLIQSRTWVIGISAGCVGISIIVGLYARRKHHIVNSAAVKIEGRSIDSLNIATLNRRVNRSLVIQEAHHVATIAGEDLKIALQYTGYCRTGEETAIEFSIDTDSNTPFDGLKCFAYDLQHDPARKHRIRPILVGPDGISKKIAVPFLEPLSDREQFSVLLKCELPGCMKAGREYYTSTLSFAQNTVRRYTVRLQFLRERPVWVRVYECSASGSVRLLKDLQPLRATPEICEYMDAAEDVAAQSARVYMFLRETAAMHSYSVPG